MNTIDIDKTKPLFTIGIVAEMINMSTHTLRMYENKGLVIPFKTESGRRIYSLTDLNHIKCIRHYIENMGLNISGIKAMYALLPCWKMLPCSEKEQEACDAFNSVTEPCWNVNKKAQSCLGKDCRTCSVYTLVNSCLNIKSFIKDHLGSFEVKGS